MAKIPLLFGESRGQWLATEHVPFSDRFRKTEGEGPDEGWFCSASAAAQYEPLTWIKRQLLGQENGGYMVMMVCFFFVTEKPWGYKDYILP